LQSTKKIEKLSEPPSSVTDVGLTVVMRYSCATNRTQIIQDKLKQYKSIIKSRCLAEMYAGIQIATNTNQFNMCCERDLKITEPPQRMHTSLVAPGNSESSSDVISLHVSNFVALQRAQIDRVTTA
jgi:hypothetical protein